MSKKNKKDKKEKSKKTLEERKIFVEDMKNQFILLGCNPSQYPPMKKLFDILDDYVENGTESSGKIDFLECPRGGRTICYILTNRKNFNNTLHFLLKDRNLVINENNPNSHSKKFVHK